MKVELWKGMCQCRNLCALPSQRQNPWVVNRKSSRLYYTNDPIKKKNGEEYSPTLSLTINKNALCHFELSWWFLRLFLVQSQARGVPSAEAEAEITVFAVELASLWALIPGGISSCRKCPNVTRQIKELNGSVTFRRFLGGRRFKGVLCTAFGQGKMRMERCVRQ